MDVEYMLILPIDHMQIGSVYPKGVPLPLHCTLMPWFELGSTLNRAQLSKLVGNVADSLGVSSILLVSECPKFFESTEPQEFKVKKNKVLDLLHTGLLICLAQHCCRLPQPQHIGAGFDPYIATVGDSAFTPHMRVRARSVLVIERDEEGYQIVMSRHSFWFSARPRNVFTTAF